MIVLLNKAAHTCFSFQVIRMELLLGNFENYTEEYITIICCKTMWLLKYLHVCLHYYRRNSKLSVHKNIVTWEDVYDIVNACWNKFGFIKYKNPKIIKVATITIPNALLLNNFFIF